MKRKLLFILPLLISTLSSCNNEKYFKPISFKEYIEIINSQEEGQRCIVIVTAPTCSHCKEMEPYVVRYAKENSDINIYKLSVELVDNSFKDTTMGIYKDSKEDMLKLLDYRIAKYKNATKVTDLLFNPTSTYNYLYTPTTIWYENKMEVKIKNSFNEKDYESFKTFIEFEEKNDNWVLAFDLKYYSEETKED